MEKPTSAAGYLPEWGEHARAACLYVATVLGDLLIEELVVVGGLVPRRDFTSADLVGPLRSAEFSGDANQDVIREDVVGFVTALLVRVDQRAGD